MSAPPLSLWQSLQMLVKPPPSVDGWLNLSPLHEDDGHLLRPYFLVPLDHPYHEERMEVLAQVAQHQQETLASQGPITDIFVLSHGWHRNIYGAVSAYDRLVSRALRLARRDRLSPFGNANFHPVFLCVHWHSDPGAEGFTDRAGRRDREDFLRRIAERLEPIPAAHEPESLPQREAKTRNDFDTLYTLFSTMAAPGRDALTDQQVQQLRKAVGPMLAQYRVRGAPGDSPAERSAAAWACYHEAESRKPLQDGNTTRHSFLNPGQALGALGKFVLAVAPITMLLGLIPKVGPAIVSGVRDFKNWLLSLAEQAPLVGPVLKEGSDKVWRLWETVSGAYSQVGGAMKTAFAAHDWVTGATHLGEMALLVAATALPLAAYLALVDFFISLQRNQRRNQPGFSAETPLDGATSSSLAGGLALAAWLPLQLVCAAPLLAWLLITYVCGVVHNIDWFPQWGLFNERASHRYARRLMERQERWRARTSPDDLPMPHKMGAVSDEPGFWETQPLLAHLARWPTARILSILRADSPVHAAITTVDCQLAFFEMQHAGVRAGEHAGAFLQQLAHATDEEAPTGIAEEEWREIAAPMLEGIAQRARFHLVGHSFGGLVAANIARHLHRCSEGRPFGGGIHSVCLVQGALGSNWFQREPELIGWLGGMGTRIACIFSAYDTANGFYYPAGNRGRVSAGYAGLLPPAQPLGRYAALSHPPDLNPPCPPFLNVDASRLIYAGPVATGGGHVDIYKDDVSYLIWGAVAPTVSPPAETGT